MDLSMHKPVESFEGFPYRHKKFDVHKRPRDEDETQQQQLQPALEIKQCSASSPATHFIFNPHFCGGAERVSTPYSTDSNCSSDYAGFVSFFSASSTPTAKRRRLFTPGTQYTFSPSEDSGISMTPQKPQQQALIQQQQPMPLKRKLKPSALAEPPAKQQKNSVSTLETAIPATKLIVDLTLNKRNNNNINSENNNNNNNKTNSANAVPSKPKTAQKCSVIKAALKPAFKSTPAGTLDLDAAKTSPNHRPLPPAAATVLSRISEDRLRSICKYHGNMVRQFPKKERTPKDQERRNKNTIACRMSRRLKKLEHIAVEVELKESERQYVKLMEERLRVQTYLEQLLQLTNGLCENGMIADEVEEAEIDVVSVNDESSSPLADTVEWKYQRADDVASEVPRKPIALLTPPQNAPAAAAAVAMPIITNAFSIAYLMGNLRK